MSTNYCIIIKNLLFLVILKKEKSGSVQFQILNLTNKIRKLTSHLELHRKDYFSKRSLLKILGKRQRLMDYLSKKKGETEVD